MTKHFPKLNTPSTIAYLGLGSNLGDREANLRVAIEHICHLEHVEYVDQSSFYETKARIVEEQPDFVNACMAVHTCLSPHALLQALLAIETHMGRIRVQDKGPRVIDLDILFYGDLCLQDDELCIPHPEIQNRAFVLVPLAELAPKFMHPNYRQTIAELTASCEDTGWVSPLMQNLAHG